MCRPGIFQAQSACHSLADLPILVFVTRSHNKSKFHALSSVLLLRWRRVSCAAAVIIGKLLSLYFQRFWSFAVLIHAFSRHCSFLLGFFPFCEIHWFRLLILFWFSHSSVGTVFCAEVKVPFRCFLVSIQHGNFAIFIWSTAATVLPFMYLSGCVDFFIRIVYERASPSWSQSEFESFPSTASSSSEHRWLSFTSSSDLSVLLFNSLLSFFHFSIIVVSSFFVLLDCMMRRSILRCVDGIKLSFSLESVHVPEAQFRVGGDHHVELAKPVTKKVRFRSQLLFVLRERRPRFPNTIFDLGRLLLLECSRLVKIFGTFFFC